MLYLSRLILDLRSREVRRDLANVQQLHCTILHAFPAAPTPDAVRQHFGVLFRAEPFPDQPLQARVLVQSTVQPDWMHLPAGYLAPPTADRPNPAVRPLDDYEQLTEGMFLRFRLRANPTCRIGKNNIKQKDKKWLGKRVELRGEDEQIEWLERKAEHGGFRLLSVQSNPQLADTRVNPQANVIGYRPDTSKKMTFGAALFEGLLEVRDVDQFQQTLIAGIGSGKAYGFGLLSIATVSGGAR